MRTKKKKSNAGLKSEQRIMTNMKKENPDPLETNNKVKQHRIISQLTLNDFKKQEFAKNYIGSDGKNITDVLRETFPGIEAKTKRGADLVEAGNFMLADPDVQRYYMEMTLKIREGHCRNKNDILSDIYEIMCESKLRGKYKDALEALKLEARILGLGETKVDVNVSHGFTTLQMVQKHLEEERKLKLEQTKKVNAIEASKTIEAEVIDG